MNLISTALTDSTNGGSGLATGDEGFDFIKSLKLLDLCRESCERQINIQKKIDRESTIIQWMYRWIVFLLLMTQWPLG